jgi:hypothetical protein
MALPADPPSPDEGSPPPLLPAELRPPRALDPASLPPLPLEPLPPSGLAAPSGCESGSETAPLQAPINDANARTATHFACILT